MPGPVILGARFVLSEDSIVLHIGGSYMRWCAFGEVPDQATRGEATSQVDALGPRSPRRVTRARSQRAVVASS
jgi:hypothetical protein